MERYFWKGKIKKGSQDEYIKRHNNLWPEMKKALKEAGICNYSIYMSNNEVYGYYECEKGIEFAIKSQNNNPIVQKWEQHMKDILVFENKDSNEAQPKIAEVFHLD